MDAPIIDSTVAPRSGAFAPGMSRPRADLDAKSRRWVDRLQPGHPHRDRTVARLHELLLRAAFHELSRRRGQLCWVTGPEFEDVAHQAADDALISILARIGEFRGLSQFTTWAYKFAMFEASTKVARHAWRRQAPSAAEPPSDPSPHTPGPGPDDQLDRRERLRALSDAIGQLSDRQHEVFVAVALNDVSVDELAVQLDSNSNAIYKNLFDARRALRARMAIAGYP